MVKRASLRALSLTLLAGGLLAGCSDDSSARPEVLGGPGEPGEPGEPGSPDNTNKPGDAPTTEASLDGLSSIEVSFNGYKVLGPNDECTELDGQWTIDVRASMLVATKRCAAPTADRPGYHWVTQYDALTAEELGALKQKLASFQPQENPRACSHDKPPSNDVVLRWPDRDVHYIEEYYSCFNGGAIEIETRELAAFVASVRDLGQGAKLGVASGLETSFSITHEGDGDKGPNDECVGDESRWAFDFESGIVRGSVCTEATSGQPRRVLKTREAWLDLREQAELRVPLATIGREPPPEPCTGDAPENGLTLVSPAGTASYVGAAGGCRDEDVITVSDAALLALINRLYAYSEP
jgi:hypothetical protein